MKNVRPREPFIGPLASWELFRLARRGQCHRTRLAVLYLLATAVVLAPVLRFHNVEPEVLFFGPAPVLSIAERAAFGSNFALWMLEAVLLAVAVLAPGYAAAAIAEEKERGTLTLLLTSGLSDREIVLGKAAGRLGFLLAAAAAAVPVLAVALPVGGVSPAFLLAGLSVITSTTTLAVAIGTYSGCSEPDLRSAFTSAYGTALLLVGGAALALPLTPFAMLVYLQENAEPQIYLICGVGYPLLQLAFALNFLAQAVRRVREAPSVPPGPVSVPPAPVIEPAMEEDGAPLPERHPPWVQPRGLPPVDEFNPLLWKERHVNRRRADGSSTNLLVAGGVLLGGLAALLLVIGAINLLVDFLRPPGMERSLDSHSTTGGPLFTGGVLSGGLYLTLLALGLSASVARERRRQTLDGLLTLPLDRRAILWAKLRAAAERGWCWAIGAVFGLGMAFATNYGEWAGLGMAGFVVGAGMLVAGLGTWLSVRCTSEVLALRFVAPAVVAAIGVPVMLWNADRHAAPWWSAGQVALAAAACAVAGGVFWLLAGRAFNRIG